MTILLPYRNKSEIPSLQRIPTVEVAVCAGDSGLSRVNRHIKLSNQIA